MKKSVLFIIALIIAAFTSGCAPQELIYEGQLMSEYEAEERIADKLEVENPDLDLEVNIAPESDD